MYHLDTDRTTCVRFDRHAVYLGSPSVDQRCPAHAAGRTESILVQPLLSHTSSAANATARALPAPTAAGVAAGDGSSARLVSAARGVVVTATWRRDPAVIQHALRVRSLAAVARSSIERPAPTATAAGAPAQPGEIYHGLGFDACSAPSPGHMAAWNSSPYRAVGIYIGGTNMACSQPNLTAAWVSKESAANWHLIPIYIGLQAPANTCGCTSISPGGAAGQGAAAARDAVARARALGLGSGNPIYYDMEAYARVPRSSSTALAFLAAWTAQLHASGYKSGVYSSTASGIADLVSRYGTGYLEPDELWIANWNGIRSTSDRSVPSSDWAAHQRLHQYIGSHNETYGGVTINIDGDFLDAATAAAGSFVPELTAAPSLTVSPAANGSIDLYANWFNASQISSWQIIAGATPTSLAPVAKSAHASSAATIVMHSAYAYFAARALGPGGELLGTSAAVATPRHLAIFGPRVYVPSHGLADLPVGCFGTLPCLVSTRISTGKRAFAKTKRELVQAGGGLVYFKVSRAARQRLRRSRHHRLSAQVTVRGASGRSATRRLTLVSVSTSGPTPAGAVSQSEAVRIVGRTDFVSSGWAGAILAGCLAPAPCNASTTIRAAGKVIARSGPHSLGVGELGYLPFRLTPAGHRLLRSARGNRLRATVTIRTPGATIAAPTPVPSPPTTLPTPAPPTNTAPTPPATAPPATAPPATAPPATAQIATAQIALVSFG